MTITVAQITAAIVSGQVDEVGIAQIVAAIKFNRAQTTKKVTAALRKGSKVQWVNSRSGVTMSGTVTKVNRKFVVIDTPVGGWRVPGNMLTVVA